MMVEGMHGERAGRKNGWQYREDKGDEENCVGRYNEDGGKENGRGKDNDSKEEMS